MLTFEMPKLSVEVKGHQVISAWLNAVGQSSREQNVKRHKLAERHCLETEGFK